MTTPAARRPSRAVTLEEVADRAGVSRATASRVLRGATNVSPEARESVLAAASEISYTPNLAARTLVTGRSDSLGFLVQETEERVFADPFFPSMLRGAHKATAAAGLQLLFTLASGPEDQDRFVSYAAAGHVDGVLLVSLHGRPTVADRLESLGVPVVLMGRPLSATSDLFYVDADNLAGGRLATQHLLDAGRHTVATVAGPQNMAAGLDRLAGYREAVSESLGYDASLVAEAEFTAESGERAMTRLLADRPDLDAVFVASDLAAFGAMRALRTHGRRMPEDVAVVGFDDIPEAAQHYPRLTTIRQPIAELSALMTERLLARIGGGHPPHRTVLPVELVARESA